MVEHSATGARSLCRGALPQAEIPGSSMANRPISKVGLLQACHAQPFCSGMLCFAVGRGRSRRQICTQTSKKPAQDKCEPPSTCEIPLKPKQNVIGSWPTHLPRQLCGPLASWVVHVSQQNRLLSVHVGDRSLTLKRQLPYMRRSETVLILVAELSS